MSLFDRAVASALPIVPRSVVRRVSAPYIAGATLDDARRTVATLNTAGKRATVDVLGEEIHTEAEARAIAAMYSDVLEAIEEDGLDANISVKLTGLGIKLDLDLCRSLLEGLVHAAGAQGALVRIDMEDATCVDDTLALYRELRGQGLDNVGIVLQAYLKRTLDDIEDLRDLRPSVRLCKGIYIEPRAIAFQDFAVVQRSFLGCLEALLDRDSRVGIATHDEHLLVESLARVEGRPTSGYEFQMLLGVREGRATELVAAGHPVRVYVPFGQQWYEYSLRRLQENPRMAGVIAKATMGRAVGRS
ncbi:proline dehydrogenase family protein [Gaiella sp.]|uniref:proline dehydrogenase family protein n=1 Tax=Gaiella sp. TaxID=2663207 RepID=UPI003983D214